MMPDVNVLLDASPLMRGKRLAASVVSLRPAPAGR